MANEVVLDASALLTLMRGEPGADIVAGRLAGAILSTLNAAEVGDVLLRHGGSREGVERALRELPLVMVEPDFDLAMDASALMLKTRAAGLSLGDRFCLALGRRVGRIALTADRAWEDIATTVGVEVELIR